MVLAGRHVALPPVVVLEPLRDGEFIVEDPSPTLELVEHDYHVLVPICEAGRARDRRQVVLLAHPKSLIPIRAFQSSHYSSEWLPLTAVAVFMTRPKYHKIGTLSRMWGGMLEGST